MTLTPADYQAAAGAMPNAPPNNVILSALRIASAAVAYVEHRTPDAEQRRLWLVLEATVKAERNEIEER